MTSNPTYDDYLQKIEMRHLLEDAGYTLNKRDGLRYPSYVRFDSSGNRVRGDKFIVTQDGKMCFQPPLMKVYNAISFIKTFPHLFPEYANGVRGDRLVNKVCSRLLNTPYIEREGPGLRSSNERRPFSMDDYSTFSLNPSQKESYKRFYPYFKSRHIDLSTQIAFRKHFMLATKQYGEGKVYTNLAFPLYLPSSTEGKIVGLEERGAPKQDGSSGYKMKAEGSNSSEGLWIANLTDRPLEKAEKVLWFESAFDAMSYYQLHRHGGNPVKGVYVSSGGNVTEKQIQGMLGAAPAAVHHLCFDNDPAGHSFAERVSAHTDKAVLDFAPDGSKDWNEALVKSETEREQQREQEQSTYRGFHR